MWVRVIPPAFFVPLAAPSCCCSCWSASISVTTLSFFSTLSSSVIGTSLNDEEVDDGNMAHPDESSSDNPETTAISCFMDRSLN